MAAQKMLVDEGDTAEFIDVEPIATGGFRVAGYPFLTSQCAMHDLVRADMRGDVLYFREVVRDGGYSSFGVVVEEADPFEIARILEQQGAIVAQKADLISAQVKHSIGERFNRALSRWETQRFVAYSALKRARAY